MGLPDSFFFLFLSSESKVISTTILSRFASHSPSQNPMHILGGPPVNSSTSVTDLAVTI